MKFYILCKNESTNIQKCIESLLLYGMQVIVYDSGSTDNTLDIVKRYPVEIVNYHYINHLVAYNDITLNERESFCGILDADMEVTSALIVEIKQILKNAETEVIICPIEMYTEGSRLSYGNLCPPKPIIFLSGKSYFESVGHGERLNSNVKIIHTKNVLIHNDLKPYISYLNSQVRYADNFIQRADQDQLTWRDSLRLKTPLLIFLTPFYSLLIKGGIFSKRSWIYAIDRLIAEAIMYRRSLVKQLTPKKNK